ncbi:MAG: MBOAT family protein [Bacteroidales bacterium]|nr:MBOAT family protein [Bacteroidales bacterium]
MLFNSIEFLIFLPIVFAIYWLLKGQLKWQNAFVVIASYFFYGWWDWRFLILIAFTSACSYASGIWIGKIQNENDNLNEDDNHFYRRRGHLRTKRITTANIVVNLLILGVFKYYNFFIESFVALFPTLSADHLLLNIILPVGISFYTFQALSYSIDIYRRKLEPTHDAIAFFAYVSFFPQLVAGPIERATNLLPQFEKKRTFNYATAVDGCRQMLWGFFKKMVIADRCAVFVDNVWSDYANQSGSTLVLAAICFTFQIYGDFSGYSDIAIGTAKLFGIRLRRNFNVPYFSRDIAEFWRRWHISLTTWFRDYLYIPLGGSRVSKAKIVRNTFIIFLVSGLWHGANWTFVAWGAYHALLFLPLILLGKNRRNTDVVAKRKMLPSLRELLQMILTFALAVIGWIIFRAESIGQAADYFSHILSRSLVSKPQIPGLTLIFILLMLITEWITRTKEHGLVISTIKQRWIRYFIYYTLVICILLFSFESETFIYFQF